MKKLLAFYILLPKLYLIFHPCKFFSFSNCKAVARGAIGTCAAHFAGENNPKSWLLKKKPIFNNLWLKVKRIASKGFASAGNLTQSPDLHRIATQIWNPSYSSGQFIFNAKQCYNSLFVLHPSVGHFWFETTLFLDTLLHSLHTWTKVLQLHIRTQSHVHVYDTVLICCLVCHVMLSYLK